MSVLVDAYGRPLVARRPETREIAAVTVRDRWSSYPSQGLTPERLARILKEADAGDVYRQAELFEEIEEKDAHLASIMQVRKNAVLGLDWEVLPFSDKRQDRRVAEFVSDVLGNLPRFEEAMLDLLDAIGKGFSVCEIMWDVTGGVAVPVELRWRHQKKFRFDELGRIRVLTESEPARGIELPPAKFIVHKYKARSGSTPRAGVFRSVVWMYLFKNFAVKDWAAFAEVYGMPLRVGKYPAGASQEEKDALIEALRMLGSDAAGIISKETEIEFVTTLQKSDGVVYEKLTDFANREMSKAVLGQTLTTEIGDRGSYAASKTHAEVRQDLVEADARALAETLRIDLIGPIVLFNFGADAAARLPWIRFHTEPPEDKEREAKVYATLIKDVGLPIGVNHVYDKFGVPRPEPGEPVLTPQPAVPMKASAPLPERPPSVALAQQALDALADRVLAMGVPAFRRLGEQLLEVIRQADSLEGLRDRLVAAYPQLDTRELEELLAQAMYVADLFGRWAASG